MQFATVVLCGHRYRYDDLHAALIEEDNARLQAMQDPTKKVNATSRKLLAKVEQEMLLTAFRALAGVPVRTSIETSTEPNHEHENPMEVSTPSRITHILWLSTADHLSEGEDRLLNLAPPSLKRIATTTFRALQGDYQRVR